MSKICVSTRTFLKEWSAMNEGLSVERNMILWESVQFVTMVIATLIKE